MDFLKYERIFSIVFEVSQGKELLGAVFDEPVKGLLSWLQIK